MNDTPKTAPEGLARPSERIAAITEGLSIQARIGASEAALGRARQLVSVARRAMTNSNVDEAQGALAGAESEFRKVDARFSEAQVAQIGAGEDSKEGLGQYVGILASDPVSSKSRTSRVEELAYRLARSRTDDGKIVLLPPREARALLAQALSGRKNKPGARMRADAIEQFDAAIRGVELASSLDAYLDSGGHRDLVGYKITLGDFLLDPDVLVAAARYHAALHNRVQAHAKTHRVPAEGLITRLRNQEMEASATLGASGAPRPTKSVDPQRPRTAGEPKTSTAPQKSAAASTGGKVRPVLLGVIAIGLLIGAGVLVWGFGMLQTGPYEPLSAAELETLPSVLVRGWITSDMEERSFVGQVSRAKPWTELPQGERRAAAEQVRSKLQEWNVTTAVIKQGSQPVVQITGDEITYLE